ncbi:hypothetical protein GY03_09695 [Proteus vulgaris]|uniref:hypothetical protein n=1 Tax=Proteus vulgaris TaxID=585 RepID=UPI0021B11913|nr:hypothetical protein [Proteus vulgaris]MCT6517540.1 hypothetical protein [Proteus vulgaris]
MDRLMEIKRRTDEINKLLNDKYPSYRFNKLESEEITHKVRELKDYSFAELKKLESSEKNRSAVSFESAFILPAISEFCIRGLHGVKRNSKPNCELHNRILGASGDLDYWIFEVGRFNGK